MIKRVLIGIVDYQTTQDAQKLSLQICRSYQKIQDSTLNLTVVHIDNGNFPAVQLTQEQTSHKIQLISTNKNLGYAGALNFAIHALQEVQQSKNQEPYDAYWCLNSDLELEANCLMELVSILNQHPKVGAVGPLVLNSAKNKKIWGARGRVSPYLGTTAMTDWPKSGILPRWSYLPGCTILIRAQAYAEVRGLPNYYKLYYEETEFCVQLQKRGWELWVQRTAVAYHEVHSQKGGIPARHFAYYFIRNNLTFWNVNFGIPFWVQFPRTLFVLFREVILPLRKAQSKAEIFDRIKFSLAGLIDGFLFLRNRSTWFENRLFK